MSGLNEYLYIDRARLDAYIEQIRSPMLFEKVPIWSIELSLTGPRAEASQERHSRGLTQHEKALSLLEHLDREDLLGGPIPPFERSTYSA